MKRKDKILEKALEMFNDQGYQNVGVREIARELDISPGNLSYHYPKKEDLLIHLLEDLRSENDQWYAGYAKGESTISCFVDLFRNIFNTQYKYRGVFIANQDIQQVINQEERIDYLENANKRLQAFRSMLDGLVNNCQLSLTEAEKNHLVSMLTLFGRFWIKEAFLLNPDRDKEEAIEHYLKILEFQLNLFQYEE